MWASKNHNIRFFTFTQGLICFINILLSDGDFFGEIALVLDVARTADAIATEDTELIFFLRPELDEWLARSPYFAGRLGANLAYVLAQRLLQANKALVQAGHEGQI